MSTCSYCRERKGKRACPALGGTVCSSCCGEHRRVRIDCPADCPHLVKGSAYQRDRRAERGLVQGKAYLQERVRSFGKDEERFGYALGLEEILHRHRIARPTLRDRDCRAALAELRADLGGLALPEPCPRELREAMLREAQHLLHHVPGLTRVDRRACIEAILASIERHAAGNPDGQAYLDFIAEYFREVSAPSRGAGPEPDDGNSPRRTPSGLILP